MKNNNVMVFESRDIRKIKAVKQRLSNETISFTEEYLKVTSVSFASKPLIRIKVSEKDTEKAKEVIRMIKADEYAISRSAFQTKRSPLRTLFISCIVVLFSLSVYYFFIKSFPYQEFLSEKKGAYYMVTLADKTYSDEANARNAALEEVIEEAMRKPEFQSIDLGNNLKREPLSRLKNMTEARHKYSELNIEDAPVVIILDHKGIIFKTYDMVEAKEFLRKLQ